MKHDFILSDDAEPPAAPVIMNFRRSGRSKNGYNRSSLALKPRTNSHVISASASEFIRNFFPDATAADWNSWHWQIRNTVRDFSRLAEILELTDEEKEAFSQHREERPLAITPYYMSLLWNAGADPGLRKTVIPQIGEYTKMPCEEDDPLGEDADSPLHGLVHRYPDRVLFLATSFCSTLCRYCTRSRMVITNGLNSFNTGHWEKSFEYIAAHPEIRDVLISGGDPLTLPDQKIEYLLSRLREIPHVEIIRIGSKVPAVLPMRITDKLVKILRNYHPLFVSLHFAHPSELTEETAEACARLADAGIPLGSQTVLLAGVNDRPEIMTKLMQGLLKIRVRPYYLYQCDPVSGTGHFRTPVSKGLEIISRLRGHTSGYAVPNYVIDAPGGGGKIPLLPEYQAGYQDSNLVLNNYQGRQFLYPDEAL